MDQASTQVYTPHLKKVLKSYQAAATTSLHGPNSFMGVWEPTSDKMGTDNSTKEQAITAPTVSCSPEVKKHNEKFTELDPFLAPPPFPIQQPPLFIPPDQTRCERSETILEGETISCFVVGGEKRLCLPQILNTVLRDFSLQQINSVCDDLHIFCSRCNSEQLEVLKVSNILPRTAPSCGLITKTDAERLCSALLHSGIQKAYIGNDEKKPFQFKVYHECFGRCTGLYTPELYISPVAHCIECLECHNMFTPQKFVCHAHRATENRTCHWGFDSTNWRAYMLLEKGQEHDQLVEHLNEMKTRYDFTTKFKRKQVTVDDRDPAKRFCMEDLYSYAEFPWESTQLAYWYHAWNKASDFKPFVPFVTKDGKPVYFSSTALPPMLIKESIQPGFPSFITSDPAALQNPEKLLAASDKGIQYYSALGSHASHKDKKVSLKREIPKLAPENYQKLSSQKEEAFVEEESETCSINSEDTLSDCSFSTFSGVEDAVVVKDEESSSDIGFDLQELQSVLKVNNLDISSQNKILTEVEKIISKYQSCLTTAVHAKNILKKELERHHSVCRERSHKFEETTKSLHKEIELLKGDLHNARQRESELKADMEKIHDKCKMEDKVLIKDCCFSSKNVTIQQNEMQKEGTQIKETVFTKSLGNVTSIEIVVSDVQTEIPREPSSVSSTKEDV